MIHSAFYNTLHYSGFLCWPCKNGHSKHHFIRILVYECGCQGYLSVFLLRTALRSAQILIFKKEGSRVMILSCFSERQRSASRLILASRAQLPKVVTANTRFSHLEHIFTFGRIFGGGSLFLGILFNLRVRAIYTYFCLGELPEVAQTWIS